MTLEDFQKLAETWGGDIERWPEETRAAARVVAETPAARLVLARERQLDDFAAQRPPVSRKRAQEAAHAVALRLAAEAARERVVREKWAAWMPRMPAWLADVMDGRIASHSESVCVPLRIQLAMVLTDPARTRAARIGCASPSTWMMTTPGLSEGSALRFASRLETSSP